MPWANACLNNLNLERLNPTMFIILVGPIATILRLVLYVSLATRFGDYLLNSHYMMLPFGDLNRRKNDLFDFTDLAVLETVQLFLVTVDAGNPLGLLLYHPRKLEATMKDYAVFLCKLLNVAFILGAERANNMRHVKFLECHNDRGFVFIEDFGFKQPLDLTHKRFLFGPSHYC